MRSATINPAVQIGMGSLTGSIEKDKFADLTIVDEEMNIRKVFVRGREVFAAM